MINQGLDQIVLIRRSGSGSGSGSGGCSLIFGGGGGVMQKRGSLESKSYTSICRVGILEFSDQNK